MLKKTKSTGRLTMSIILLLLMLLSSVVPPAVAANDSMNQSPSHETTATGTDSFSAGEPSVPSGDPAPSDSSASSGDPAPSDPSASSENPAPSAPSASSGDPAPSDPSASSEDPAPSDPPAPSGDPAPSEPGDLAGQEPMAGNNAESGLPVLRGGPSLRGGPVSDFIYEQNAEGTAIRVTGWTGTGTVVVIPETIDGLPVTEITRGDESSFQNRSLTEVTIPKTVKVIGDYAFADNRITTLNIPNDSELEEIGKYAFIDSRLTSFNAPATLKTIGKAAFIQNELTSITLNEGLLTIGDEAFALNNLTEATIPASVTSFGAGVFDANGRFVKVTTESAAVPPYENNGADYGYVVDPITVTIRYIDKVTRAEVMSSVTLGTDMTDINGVFVKDVEMTYSPPTLIGYYVEPTITFTPDVDGYILVVEYTPEGPPTLTHPATILLPEGLTEEQAKSKILDAVSATDYTGKDISDKIQVDLGSLDVGENGIYDITLKLTDDYGYEIQETVKVQVGAYDWANHSIGGDWVLGDFVFSSDGTTLLALSAQGRDKLVALPAGSRNLILPPHSYNNPDVPVTAIGDWAFYNNIYNVPIESVNFSQMKELRSIGNYAFYSYSRGGQNAIGTVVGFNELKKLETIGNCAFYRTTGSFNLDGFEHLTSIGYSAFSSGSQYTRGPSITLGSLPALTQLGSGVFYGASVPAADLRGMPNLQSIPASAFAFAGVRELYFPEVDHDFSIGSQAFYRNYGLTAIDFTPIAEHLTSIGYEAFETYSSTIATNVTWPAMPKLQSVGSKIFYYRNLNMDIDLSTSPLLTTIGSNAFQQAGLTGVTLPETVETIGSYAFYSNSSSAFYNNRIADVDFSLLTRLKTIGSYAFYGNRLTSVDLSHLPALETIGNNSFQSNHLIETVHLDDLPALKSIQSSAFANNRIAELNLGDLPALETIGASAFYSNRLASLTIDSLPSLTSIGANAFYNNALTGLVISNNPELTSLGDYIFAINQLAEATIDQCPKLTELEPYAFHNNPGHSAYYNNVVVWDLPKDESVMPSKANYLVNPDTEEPWVDTWVPDDFTYTVSNGEATITGFTDQGAKRFGSGVRPVVFPAEDPDGNPVVSIGASAFTYKNIGSIDLTGMTHLRTIAADAFSYNDLTEVDFSGLDNLVEISNNAFRNNKIASLDLGVLPKLQTIGNYAFNSNVLNDVNFAGLDSLTRIGSYAFSNNLLTDVDLGVLSRLQAIDSYAFSSNRIVNLNLEGAVSLVTIGSSAFSYNRISDLNFGYLPKLTIIGNAAFYYQQGAPLNLDLSGLPALTAIYSSAFADSNLVSLKFGDLKNLSLIDSYAFRSHKLTSELDLSGLDSLRTIGSNAFDRYSSSSDYGITKIKFPESGSLEYINSYAFRYNKLEELDLSKQTKLRYIDSYAFAYNLIADVTFPQDSPLYGIFNYAFYSNKLKEVDLSPLTNLRYIYYGAFGNNAIRDVYAPNSLNLNTSTSTPPINDGTFVNNRLDFDSNLYREAAVHIEEHTSPALRDYTHTSGWGHLINPKKVFFTYKDRDGNELLPSNCEYCKSNVTSKTFYAPDMAKYLAEKPAILVEFNDTDKEYHVDFVYDELDLETKTANVRIGHVNVGKKRAYVGERLNTSLSIGLSDNAGDFTDVELRVYFNPEYIQKVNPGAGSSFTIVQPSDGKPYIAFKFPVLRAGQSVSIPIEWWFKEDYTPYDHEEILYTQLRDSDNKLISVLVDENGDILEPPTISAYYDPPYIEKGVLGGSTYDTYIGGPREAGTFKTETIDGQEVMFVDEPVDVAYTFRIMQTMSNRNFDRNIETITYIDKLPEYQAVENGAIVTKTAVINLETSPGWSYYDPVTEQPTDQVTGYGIVTMPNYNKDYAFSYPSLKLQFPGGVKGKTVSNSVTAKLMPVNKPEYEDVIEIENAVPISLEALSNPPTGTGAGVVYSTRFRKSVYPTRVLDYNPRKRDAVFKWPLTFTVGTEDLAEGKVFTNLVFEDFDLDDRLVYTEIQLPSANHTAIVKAYRTDGTEITEYGGETTRGVFTFPEYSIGMERIDKITVDLGDREVLSSYSINVVTVFANPDDPSKEYYAGYSSTNHASNDLHNTAKVSYKVGDVTGESRIITTWATIQPLALKAIPTKAQTFNNSELGGSSHNVGDKGTYTIGLSRMLNDEPFTMTEADLPINNFRMVDLLPLDIIVNHSDIKLTAEFARQPGAKFEVIGDYGTTGRSAIVFTAASVAADVTTIATIDAKLSAAMEKGLHTNDLYLSFDRNEEDHWGYGQAESTDNLGDNPEHPYMRTHVSLSLHKAIEMNAVKSIRNAKKDSATGKLVGTGTWSEGVYTENKGYFQYRLLIRNDSDEATDQNELYDVFPYRLDQVTQMNQQGKRRNRGSAFCNTILAARLYGTTAGQFKIQYTTYSNTEAPIRGIVIEDNVEAGAFLSTLPWADAGSNGAAPDGATAMRVIPKGGPDNTGMIKADDTLIVVVDAQAPEHNAETSGKRAYNSFVRGDSVIQGGAGILWEPPSVWNEVPAPKGTLTVEKRSRTFDPVNQSAVAYNVPLAGAEFTLYTTSGIEVAKAISGDDGKATFTDIMIGDYILKETGVPAGHYPQETQIEVYRSEWEEATDLNYTLPDPVYNSPIVTGRVEIEKVNAEGNIMPGISFTLTNKTTGDKYVTSTNSEGKATFTDIPYGAYTLTETNPPRLLAPITRDVKICCPEQEVLFTGNDALRNDRANVSLFKLGIRGKLDPSKDLSQYVKADGTIVAETWSFEIKNRTNSLEADRTVTYLNSDVRNGVVISGLTVNDVYEITELSGPAQNATLYNLNPAIYTFKVNTAGELVDVNGEPFKTQNIYFPNERKDVDGSVVITKEDAEGNVLEGATFSLSKLNKQTSEYEELERKNSDISGLVQWDELGVGSYEIREIAAPAGYFKAVTPYRFVVEDYATTSMLTNPNYEHREGGLTHKFSFTCVNRKIDLKLVKRHLIASNVPEAEKDLLLAQNPAYKADAKLVGYDVYEVLGGAEFTLYKEETNENGETVRTVLGEELVSDADGVIPVHEIAGFKWEESGIYYLEETKTKDDTWLLPTRPIKIDVASVLRNNPDGVAKVFMENQPKRGEVLVSKYDRYTGRRLAGIEFTLYRGTAETYSEDTVYAKALTDNYGYIRFLNLPLGQYVLKETKTLEGYVLDETLHEVTVTPEDRYFYYHIYNIQEGELLDIPVKKNWLGKEPDYAAGEGLVVELYEGTNTTPMASAVLTKANGWSYVFEDLLKLDAQGRPYIYWIREKDVPVGYKVAVGEGRVDASAYPQSETVANEVVLKNHALGKLSVTKAWQDFCSDLRPASVQLTLMRAAFNSETGQYGQYVALGQPVSPVSISASTETPWSYTWENLETHDLNGKPYRFKIVEGDMAGYVLANHTPAEVELALGEVKKIELTNRQLLTVKAKKVWSDNSPAEKPPVVFQLVRKTDSTDYQPVQGAVLKMISSGGGWVEWTALPATDDDGNRYTYSVYEGYIDETDAFVHQVPENYRAETARNPIHNEANIEIGTEVTITNTWQERSFTAKKYWENTPSVKPEVKLVLRQNGELYLTDGQPKTPDSVTSEVTWSNLPKYYYYKNDNGEVEEREYKYTVDEVNVPESYTKELLPGGTEVKNTYHSVSLEAKKEFDLTQLKDDFQGADVYPEAIVFSLYKTAFDEAKGETYMKKFDTVVLDGVVDTDITDGGETAKWVYTWYKLPKYYEVKNDNGQITLVENEYQIVEEMIPKNYELESVKDVSSEGMFSWEVTNTYRNGFTAHKKWDLGDKTAAQLGGLPAIQLQLCRGIELDDGTRISESVWFETVGDPVTLDGVADNLGLGVDRETTQENSLTWTYSWFDDPVYGTYEGTVDLSAYGISSGDTVQYYYFAKEIESAPKTEDYSIDTVSSSSTLVVNRLDKTEFTAKKVWVNGPVNNRPEVEFVLYSDYIDPSTGKRTEAEEVARATLDGVVDTDGEFEAWTYEFKNLKHYVKDEEGKYLKDADSAPVLYRYFVKEETVPENYKVDEILTDDTITNSYVIPKQNLAFTKIWSGGNPDDYDNIQLDLYRKSDVMEKAKLVSSDPERTATSETEFVYTFKNLDVTDLAGNVYTYFVQEARAVDGVVTIGSNQYQVAITGETITNTYILKQTEVEVNKVWEGGAANNRPEIWFKLYRSLDGGDPEAVPNADAKQLEPGASKVVWTEIESEAAFNKPYTFSVKEGVLDAESGEFKEESPENYEVTYVGLTVTNTYVIPPTDIEATKTWVGGSAVAKPSVYFRLMRQTEGGLAHVTPDTEILGPYSEDVTLQWEKVDLTDFDGNVYRYFVEEGTYDEETGVFVVGAPEPFELEGSDLELINTFKPATGTIKAVKKWVGIPHTAKHPTIWFKLYRELAPVQGADPSSQGANQAKREAVPNAEILKLVNGVTKVQWEDIELEDPEGNAYQFTVQEVDAFGNDYTPKNYKKSEKGLTVTNTYKAYSVSPITGETLNPTTLFAGIALVTASVLITMLLIARRRKSKKTQ